MGDHRVKQRVLVLIVVAVMLMVGVVGFSMRLLPDAPIGPTATFAKGIDFPDGRPVPSR
jgi:hypothetical protein